MSFDWKNRGRIAYSRKILFGKWRDKICCVCGKIIGIPEPVSLSISKETMCFGCPEPEEGRYDE